jgi:hypothetical protein
VRLGLRFGRACAGPAGPACQPRSDSNHGGLRSVPDSHFPFLGFTPVHSTPVLDYPVFPQGNVFFLDNFLSWTSPRFPLKPGDSVFVGMFPKFRDEVKENAERVCRILARA